MRRAGADLRPRYLSQCAGMHGQRHRRLHGRGNNKARTGSPEWSIEPAGSSKLSFINGLYVSGLRRSAQRPYSNYPDYLIAWHAWLNGMEPNRVDPVYRQIIDGVAGYRSVWWQLDFWRDAARNSVPVFQVQGLTDDLFPLPEAKRMLLALKAVDPGYPIADPNSDIITVASYDALATRTPEEELRWQRDAGQPAQRPAQRILLGPAFHGGVERDEGLPAAA